MKKNSQRWSEGLVLAMLGLSQKYSVVSRELLQKALQRVGVRVPDRHGSLRRTRSHLPVEVMACCYNSDLTDEEERREQDDEW